VHHLRKEKREKALKYLVLLIIVCDQAVKSVLIKTQLLAVIVNKGISFGLFPSAWWLALNILIVLLVFLLFIKAADKISLLLILGAGISNLFDRIIRGGVIDYIKLPLFPWSFNLADMAITAGLLLYFRQIIQVKK